MPKCSIEVPWHFTDGDKEIDGGVQEAEVKDALRWAADGKAILLDASVKPSEPEAETPKAKPAKPSA